MPFEKLTQNGLHIEVNEAHKHIKIFEENEKKIYVLGSGNMLLDTTPKACCIQEKLGLERQIGFHLKSKLVLFQ